MQGVFNGILEYVQNKKDTIDIAMLGLIKEVLAKGWGFAGRSNLD